jgi:hypothetical protein
MRTNRGKKGKSWKTGGGRRDRWVMAGWFLAADQCGTELISEGQQLF